MTGQRRLLCLCYKLADQSKEEEGKQVPLLFSFLAPDRTPVGELHSWLSQDSYPSWKNKLAACEVLGNIHSQAGSVILKSPVDYELGLWVFGSSCRQATQMSEWDRLVFFGFFCLFFCLFAFPRAAPAAYGGSQARGLIGDVAYWPMPNHSNEGSEPRLQPPPQLTATPDP